MGDGGRSLGELVKARRRRSGSLPTLMGYRIMWCASLPNLRMRRRDFNAAPAHDTGELASSSMKCHLTAPGAILVGGEAYNRGSA
ncbi:hypothetical protein F441_00906, partial [Phytophthora nicotianae CJ01A1]